MGLALWCRLLVLHHCASRRAAVEPARMSIHDFRGQPYHGDGEDDSGLTVVQRGGSSPWGNGAGPGETNLRPYPEDGIGAQLETVGTMCGCVWEPVSLSRLSRRESAVAADLSGAQAE